MFQLLEDYREQKLSRRGLMARAAALGVTASALGNLLAREAAAAPARQDEPKTGGTLREGYDLDCSKLDPVASIEAPDELTLVLHMSHPYYEVLNVVKTGYWAIANIETRKKLAENYGQSGVDGTGPFLFQEWVPGSHTSVTRWEDYPGSIVPYFTNKGKAYLDGIRWETILEGAQRAIKIENGEIDTLR